MKGSFRPIDDLDDAEAASDKDRPVMHHGGAGARLLAVLVRDVVVGAEAALTDLGAETRMIIHAEDAADLARGGTERTPTIRPTGPVVSAPSATPGTAPCP